MVSMPVSLPLDKLTEIQHLAHSLLQMEPVTVHQVMSFLGKITFCGNGHAQLCQLCHVIQGDILNAYHSPAHAFYSFQLSLPAQHQLKSMS